MHVASANSRPSRSNIREIEIEEAKELLSIGRNVIMFTNNYTFCFPNKYHEAKNQLHSVRHYTVRFACLRG